LIWFRVHVIGDPQHASGYLTVGANAIEKAFGVWQHLKQLEAEWNARKSNHPVYKDHPHPIRFNLGGVSGGEWTSSVPAACTLEVRVGVYPGWKLEDARAQIEARVHEAAMADPYLAEHPPTITYHGHMAEGYVLQNASAPERALGDSHRAVFGEPLLEHISSAATDARFFGLYQDTPALVYGPSCEGPHGFDERVDLDSVKAVTKTIALFIADWCGIERGRGGQG
jgi:acetylornithine deacetylase